MADETQQPPAESAADQQDTPATDQRPGNPVSDGSSSSSPSVEPDQDETANPVTTTHDVAVTPDAPTVTLPADALPVAQPVRVDNRSRRSGEDSLEGGWVDIVAGEHEGRRGSFESVEEHDPKTGYPVTILVRTRDEKSELLAVAYEDTRPAVGYLGGR